MTTGIIMTQSVACIQTYLNITDDYAEASQGALRRRAFQHLFAATFVYSDGFFKCRGNRSQPRLYL